MWKSTKTVALEQHMDAITVAVAAPGPPTEFCGDIPSTPEAVRKLVGRLDDGKMDLRFCYEAGPCGYGLYRQLTMMGYDCSVVAPSLSPRRPGERIKTDRRDALTLARQHRSGHLVAVWVPDEEQEAIRDLVRCREDFKHAERRVRQRLNSFLLRHGRVYSGGGRWTQAHFRWLETQCFGPPGPTDRVSGVCGRRPACGTVGGSTGRGHGAGAGDLVSGTGGAVLEGTARGKPDRGHDGHVGAG